MKQPGNKGVRRRFEKISERPLVGAHVSIAGGIWRAVERAVEIRASVAQVFVKNNNQWKGKELTQEDVSSFKRTRERSGVVQVAAHAGYLINLAAPDPVIREKSISAMIDELRRCRLLGVSPLVVHPGAHRGAGTEQGIRRIAEALERIFAEVGAEVDVALEHTAGQGTGIGYRFEHLRDILGLAEPFGKLRVCLDTCHLFASGYDISEASGYRETMDAFERIVGLHRLALLHLNDSKKPLGSRVDRHQHIGKGEIGVGAFSRIMNEPCLQDIPKILETPKGKGNYWDRRNLGLLRRLCGNRSREQEQGDPAGSG